MTELLWAFLPPRNRMDVRAPCKGQRAAETTGRTELFVAADVGGLPGETEERRLMGNSRAKNTQARAWGVLAGPPAALVTASLGLPPHLCCQGVGPLLPQA